MVQGGNSNQISVSVTASGDLEGTQSLHGGFCLYEQYSGIRHWPQCAGLLYLSIGLPDQMTRYLSPPMSEQEDYWRMYVPEGYAARSALRYALVRYRSAIQLQRNSA